MIYPAVLVPVGAVLFAVSTWRGVGLCPIGGNRRLDSEMPALSHTRSPISVLTAGTIQCRSVPMTRRLIRRRETTRAPAARNTATPTANLSVGAAGRVAPFA
jgi:hypothetical protein